MEVVSGSYSTTSFGIISAKSSGSATKMLLIK